MKKAYVYGIWAVLYGICLGLGFVEKPDAIGTFFLVGSSLIFFIPPFYLSYLARKEQNRVLTLALRIICICVLALSLALLVLNFLSVYFSAQAGLVLHVLLAMASVPMFCGQYWVLSLFLWACLLIINLKKPRD